MRLEALAAALGLVHPLQPFHVTLVTFHLLRLNEVPGPHPPAVADTPRRKRRSTGRFFTSASVTLMDGGPLDAGQFAWVWGYFQPLCMDLVSEGGWERGLRARGQDLFELGGNE